MRRTSFGEERIEIIKSILMRQHARIMELSPIADLIKLPNLAALVSSLLSQWCWFVHSLVSFGRSLPGNSSGDSDRSLLRSGLLFSESWGRIGLPIAELAVEQLNPLIHTITGALMLSEQIGRAHFAMHLPELDGARADSLLHP